MTTSGSPLPPDATFSEEWAEGFGVYKRLQDAYRKFTNPEWFKMEVGKQYPGFQSPDFGRIINLGISTPEEQALFIASELARYSILDDYFM